MNPQPFDGVRVVEFGQFVAVPYAGQLLADGGADVIKIEAPIGDSSRHIMPMAPGETRIFVARNRGKRALALALKHRHAPAIIDALLSWADVALFNFRPGLAASLGLDADTLRERFPSLITASVTAFGNRGPDASLAGMDIVVQARSGLMAAQGRVVDGRPAAGEPVPADYMCAMTLSFGIASALFRRERTGVGGAVDVSLMHAAMALANNQMVYAHDHDRERRDQALNELATQRAAGASYEEQLTSLQKSNLRAIAKVYYRTYECADKAIAVACGSVKLREAFAEVIGIDDARLQAMDGTDASEHYEALREQAEAIVRARTADEWLQDLRAAGVPVSDVKMTLEMLDDEQALANGMLYVQDHPRVGPLTLLGTPVKLDDDGFQPGAALRCGRTPSRCVLCASGGAG